MLTGRDAAVEAVSGAGIVTRAVIGGFWFVC
ncbi:PREDICTED: uncharacterized protein LOC109131409 [Camelina sativa]|uniref:Uncharacterized protein LOC109131409 n=1 Tax=Camelina sativa TaxID=90675 RepID=A0ABM1RFZ6_CAMSA|nr:PREDICTED: uncharacterized protein LOC109131409 [Camelina sativa]